MNRYMPLLMTLALAACGGGGGGGGSPPTTSGAQAAANSAIGQDGKIDGTALKSTGPGPYPLTAVTASLNTSTDPAGGGLLNPDPAVTGTVSVTFDPNTNQITSVTFNQNGTDHELLGLDGTTVTNPQSVPQLTKEMISAALQGITPNKPVVLTEALNYLHFGAWMNQFQTNPPGGPHDGVLAVGVFAAGSPTPTAAVPTTGSATYTGDVAGYASMPTPAGDAHTNGTMNMAVNGAVAVGVNFATDQVTTSFSNLQAVSADSLATKGTLPNLTGTGTLTGNGYTTSIAGGPMNGTANGTLFGPAAQETGGTVTASGGGSTIVAAFGAKR